MLTRIIHTPNEVITLLNVDFTLLRVRFHTFIIKGKSTKTLQASAMSVSLVYSLTIASVIDLKLVYIFLLALYTIVNYEHDAAFHFLFIHNIQIKRMVCKHAIQEIHLVTKC